jgi:hypothetical protein
MSMELEKVLEHIQTIAAKHSLIYQLEAENEDRKGARLALLLVLPDNKSNYQIYKATNDVTQLSQYVEEEVLITITQHGNKWKAHWKWLIGKQTDVSPISLVRPEIETVLIPTDWLNAHRQLAGESERKIEVVKYHNRRWKHEYIAQKTNYAKTTVSNIVSEMRAKYPAYVRGA